VLNKFGKFWEPQAISKFENN